MNWWWLNINDYTPKQSNECKWPSFIFPSTLFGRAFILEGLIVKVLVKLRFLFYRKFDNASVKKSKWSSIWTILMIKLLWMVSLWSPYILIKFMQVQGNDNRFIVDLYPHPLCFPFIAFLFFSFRNM